MIATILGYIGIFLLIGASIYFLYSLKQRWSGISKQEKSWGLFEGICYFAFGVFALIRFDHDKVSEFGIPYFIVGVAIVMAAIRKKFSAKKEQE